jgi:uncharacterized protein (TIGR00255 family)
VELRSLNSKNLDLNVRVPQHLRVQEMNWRKMLSTIIFRGKAELNINIENVEGEGGLNEEVLKVYLRQLRKVNTELGLSNTDLMGAAMRVPDVYTSSDTIDDSEIEFLAEQIAIAGDNFNSFRIDEGKGLLEDLSNQISSIDSLLKEVPNYEEERIKSIKDRLRTALEEKFENKKIDENRFEQELIYYIEKIDVSEEKQRLANHLNYFMETLSNGENQGKKLNFISQEIGREINTLGSKSYHVELQKIVVQMKDHLEKIKEQVLNTL